MKRFVFLFLLISVSVFSQSENNVSGELKGILYQPVGNNYLSDGVEPFYGVALGISGRIINNFGVGLEFGKGYSNVKNVSVFGALKTPQFTVLDLYALYYYPITEKTAVEGNIGMSSLILKSFSDYREDGFTESGQSPLFGAKIIQSITKYNMLCLVGSARVYFFSNQVKIENYQWQNYYSKSTLLNFQIGLRLNF